jgi:DNA-binding NtrC family response regulator
LYYRLNVVPLTLPPLRERREDVPQLIAHFLEKNATAGCAAPPRFTPELMSLLRAHSWPGNIRELENLCRRAVALHPGEWVGPSFFEQGLPLSVPASLAMQDPLSISASGKSLRTMERELLESTLEANGGNRTRAARILGICPRTMRNKIREYGLPPRRYA